MSISIYTDGSCIGNPGPGGWAFVILKDREILTKGKGRQMDTTNNRMELVAVIEGLKVVQRIKDKGESLVQIFSDSNLIISTMTQNWKKKKNLDLWKKLDEVLTSFRKVNIAVDWNWVKAHNGEEFNEMVDQMANGEATALRGF